MRFADLNPPIPVTTYRCVYHTLESFSDSLSVSFSLSLWTWQQKKKNEASDRAVWGFTHGAVLQTRWLGCCSCWQLLSQGLNLSSCNLIYYFFHKSKKHPRIDLGFFINKVNFFSLLDCWQADLLIRGYGGYNTRWALFLLHHLFPLVMALCLCPHTGLLIFFSLSGFKMTLLSMGYTKCVFKV